MKTTGVRKRGASFVVAIAALVGCGQDPSFLEREATGRKSSDAKIAGSQESIDDVGIMYDENGNPIEPGAAGGKGNAGGSGTVGDYDGDESAHGNQGGNDWLPDWAQADDMDMDQENPESLPGGDGNDGDANEGGSGNNGGVPGGGTVNNPPVLEIPEAEDKDLDALHKCLAKWRNHPFKGTVNNYQRISASVSVFGTGNAINDTESTDEPFLVLVDAGVNVYGSPTYNLMNKNGYYCIKVNVNVLTTLTVNLHCNARLADSKVSVNVGSSQNDSTSAVGVNVLSTINVNTVRPQGDKCIR